MPDRSVRIKADRVSPRSRDSGLGSSTEQAHVGGRSDRLFTAQDIAAQRYSVSALNEALDTANEHLERSGKRIADLEAEVTLLRKSRRDDDAQIRCLMTDKQTLEHKLLTSHEVIDTLRQDNYQLHQTLADTDVPGRDFVISDVARESADGVKRSVSTRHGRHDDQGLKDRMKERINKNSRVTEASSSKSSSSSSLSQKEVEKKKDRRQSISQPRKPYIEDDHKSRRAPPVVTRGLEHYTVAQGVGSPTFSRGESMPRSVGSYGAYEATGDYYAAPLPPKTETKSSSNRKSRP